MGSENSVLASSKNSAPSAPKEKKSSNIGIIIAIIAAALIIAGGVVAAILIANNTGNKNDEEEEQATSRTDDNGSSKKKSKKSSNPAADDSAYTIKIDGKTFTAGDKISSFEKVNYVVRDSVKSQKVPAGKYLILIGGGSLYNDDDDTSISFTPYNDTNSSVEISDAKIGKVTVEKSSLKDKQKVYEGFEFYGGIKLGSTREELIEAFGKPTEAKEHNTYGEYETIEFQDSVYKKFEFRIEDGVVTRMEWTNYGELAR